MPSYKFEKGFFGGKLVQRNLPLVGHMALPKDFGGNRFSIKYGKTGFFVHEKLDGSTSREFKELEYMDGLNYFVAKNNITFPVLYNLQTGSSIVLSAIHNHDFAVSHTGEIYLIKDGKISLSKLDEKVYLNNGEQVYIEGVNIGHLLVVDKEGKVRIIDNFGNFEPAYLTDDKDAKIKCIDNIFDYGEKHHFVVKDKEKNAVVNSDGEIIFNAPYDSELIAKTGQRIKYFIAYNKEEDASEITLYESKSERIRKFKATGRVHHIELTKDNSMKVYKKENGKNGVYITTDGNVYISIKPNGKSILDKTKPNIKPEGADVPDDIMTQIFGNNR